MNLKSIHAFGLLIIVCFLGGCAQIIAPAGGPKDLTPPKLLSITPEDSLLDTRVTKLELRFDEFITLSNAASEIKISPILPVPLDVNFNKKTVTLKIPDSLLQSNTTYRISFGNAIQDIHENNPYAGYTYTFSTGSFFDSLSLSGYTMDAATGLRDSGALVVLYDAKKTDSAVVREKPLYAVRVGVGGNFRFDGLPEKEFRIFALKDGNDNMVFDGGQEMIAFIDSVVTPSLTPVTIRLNLFTQADTARDSTNQVPGSFTKIRSGVTEATATDGFSYIALIDTSDSRKRTVELMKPLQIKFNKPITIFNESRVTLTYDSTGIAVEAGFKKITDTAQKNMLLLNSNWKENTVYTLRLLKGFAQDSSGTDAMPGRYTFRTKRDEDYAKLHIHLPTKYFGEGYVFVLLQGDDTIHHRMVTDTMLHFTRLQPANYRMRIIVDRNKNGEWDTGDLLAGIQPEEVIPYINPIVLKAGWENMIDFEEVLRPSGKPDLSPGQRDRTRR